MTGGIVILTGLACPVLFATGLSLVANNTANQLKTEKNRYNFLNSVLFYERPIT